VPSHPLKLAKAHGLELLDPTVTVAKQSVTLPLMVLLASRMKVVVAAGETTRLLPVTGPGVGNIEYVVLDTTVQLNVLLPPDGMLAGVA
jgi:hypothetical protein